MVQKVPNMAPKLAQVGAMLAPRAVMDTPKSEEKRHSKTTPKNINLWMHGTGSAFVLGRMSKATQAQPSMEQQSITKSTKNRPKIVPKSTKNRPKIDPTSSQNRPKSTQNRPKIGSGADLASEAVLGPTLTPFWSQLGAILGGKIEPCWGHVDQKIDFLRFEKALKNDHDFQPLWRSFWGRFWDDFGFQNRPKIGPESIFRAIKQKRQTC